MHACGFGQGLPEKDKTIFHVGETSYSTKTNCDSIIAAKIENPMFENSVAIFSLSLLSSDIQLRMLKIACCGESYDALIDSGSSHNFTSQACFDQINSSQKGYSHLETEKPMENGKQVTLADRSQISSTHNTRIKVKVDGGPYLQV